MTTATLIRNETLYYRDGSSDKVYQAQITDAGNNLFHVDAYYGRRGGSLNRAAKTAGRPVSIDQANKIFDDLIREKQAKGYTPDVTGTVYVSTSNEERVTGLAPQLLNAVDEKEVERYLTDDEYIMQEKKDGVRTMIQVTPDGVVGSNRRGLSTTLPQPVALYYTGTRVAQGSVNDGELCGETYWAFDVLQSGSRDMRQMPYEARWEHLQKETIENVNIRLVPTAIGTAAKRALYAQLQAARAEGVVFKKRSAPYQAGRPASGGNQVKFKFYSTATCVTDSGRDGKRSVELFVLPNDSMTGQKDLVSVGNVTIPSNFEIPPPGTFVEVRYLYAYPGGSLYQPTYLGPRTDKDRPDVVQSLKLKPVDTDEA